MLSISDLLPSWKSSLVYFIASLFDTSKDNRDSCFVLTMFIKSLHSEAFKTDLTFLEYCQSIVLRDFQPLKEDEFYILAASLV